MGRLNQNELSGGAWKVQHACQHPWRMSAITPLFFPNIFYQLPSIRLPSAYLSANTVGLASWIDEGHVVTPRHPPPASQPEVNLPPCSLVANKLHGILTHRDSAIVTHCPRVIYRL